MGNDLFRLEIEKGIATIWIDSKKDKINIVSPSLITDFEEIFNEVNQNDQIQGAILISAKKDFRSNKHREAKTEPYELSDDERKVVLDAARSTGAFMVGVDHAIVNDNYYVLECNGSPGIGSNFALYNTNKQIKLIISATKVELKAMPRFSVINEMFPCKA